MKPPIDIEKLPKHRRDWLEIFGNQWGNRKKVMPGTCEACVWGMPGVPHVEDCEHRRRISQAEIIRPVAKVNTALAMLLVFLLLVLTVSHARPLPSCADELLIRWNQFAGDANAYVQTLDARQTSREKARAQLNREWASLIELPCW